MLVGAGKRQCGKAVSIREPFWLLILTNNVHSKAVCKYNTSMPGYGT